MLGFPGIYPMKIGIVAASPQEIKTLLPAAVKPLQTYSLGANAWLIAAGIGTENAIRAAEWMVTNGAEALLSWGLASVINPVLPAGTVLLPQRIRLERDSRLPGKPANLQYLMADKHWRKVLQARLQAGFMVSDDDILHVEDWVAGRNAKPMLYQQSAVSAADMVSAAVGWVARRAGIPFAVVRVIADAGGCPLPKALPRLLDDQGKISSAKLLPALLLRPQDGDLLLKLPWHARAGLKALRRLADSLRADFSPPEKPMIADAAPESG
jgi:adenosylhomocysteine nucleosidase